MDPITSNEFFMAFLQAIAAEQRSGMRSQIVDDLLSDISEDERKSETLFDAYRCVALARSKIVGPRVVGLLTAQIVLEDRCATDEEESVFLASEDMTDSELMSAAAFVTTALAKAQDGDERYEITEVALKIKFHSEITDDSSREAASTSPSDLYENLGRWASRLERTGLLSQDVTQQQRSYGPSNYVDEPGSETERIWNLYLSPGAITLSQLVHRATARDEHRP